MSWRKDTKSLIRDNGSVLKSNFNQNVDDEDLVEVFVTSEDGENLEEFLLRTRRGEGDRPEFELVDRVNFEKVVEPRQVREGEDPDEILSSVLLSGIDTLRDDSVSYSVVP